MKILFYTLAIALVLCACGSKVVKSNSCNAERTAIFFEKFAFNPDTSFQVGNDKILYLKKFDFEEDTFKLYVFEKTEHDWQLIKDSIFLSGYEYRVDSPEISLINGQSFFYYEEYLAGGSLGNFDIEFSLYNLSTLEKYFIHYKEFPDGNKTITEFINSDNLLASKTLQNYLEAKITSSSRVYKVTAADSLINQFKEANKQALLKVENPKFLNKSLNFNYVSSKEKVFDIHNTDTTSEIVDYSGNDRFIIISKFKGAVLGYNKSKAEYFCVWSPESLFDWIKKVQFDSKGNLILFNGEFGPNYEVDLNKFKYKKLK